MDLSLETFVHLGWSNYFAKKILHILNTFEVNGVWQHDMVNDDDDKDDEESPQLDDDVQQPTP